MIIYTPKLILDGDHWIDPKSGPVTRTYACADAMFRRWGSLTADDEIWIAISDKPVKGAIKLRSHRTLSGLDLPWQRTKIAKRNAAIYWDLTNILREHMEHTTAVWMWVEVAT